MAQTSSPRSPGWLSADFQIQTQIFLLSSVAVKVQAYQMMPSLFQLISSCIFFSFLDSRVALHDSLFKEILLILLLYACAKALVGAASRLSSTSCTPVSLFIANECLSLIKNRSEQQVTGVSVLKASADHIWNISTVYHMNLCLTEITQASLTQRPSASTATQQPS